MKQDPRWHGWATPEQVRQMMQEMCEFLESNNETNPLKSKVERGNKINDSR